MVPQKVTLQMQQLFLIGGGFPTRIVHPGCKGELSACPKNRAGPQEPECGAGGPGSASWALPPETRPRDVLT